MDRANEGGTVVVERAWEKCKSAFNEIRSSGIGRRTLALPDTPFSLSSSCALDDVPRQVQRRGFPVRWKVRGFDSRSWRRILPINVPPSFFLSLSLSPFLSFCARSVLIEPRRQRANRKYWPEWQSSGFLNGSLSFRESWWRRKWVIRVNRTVEWFVSES